MWHKRPDDALGSVCALSNTSGNIIEQYRYDAFGNTKILNAAGTEIAASAVGNPYMFTGRGSGSETHSTARTGLYYYRARIYNPKLGRFIQTDPIGYYDSMNLYQYCGNNPTNWIDPWGLTNTDKHMSRWDKFVVSSLGGLVTGIEKAEPYTKPVGNISAGVFAVSASAAVILSSGGTATGPTITTAKAFLATYGFVNGAYQTTVGTGQLIATASGDESANEMPATLHGLTGYAFYGKKGEAVAEAMGTAVDVVTGKPQSVLEGIHGGLSVVQNVQGLNNEFGETAPNENGKPLKDNDK